MHPRGETGRGQSGSESKVLPSQNYESRPGTDVSGTGCARARYAWRNLRRNPGFAAVAIATLALGIGGLTAMFSAFDTILIRPLPYADPDRLVMVWDDLSKTEDRTKSFPAPAEWLEWRRLNTAF